MSYGLYLFPSFSETGTITKGHEPPQEINLVADFQPLAPSGKKYGSTAETSGESADRIKVC